MFTGIVQSTGRIVGADLLGDGRRVRVEAPAFGLVDVKVGDSIAVNGACMTVVDVNGQAFSFEVSAESLSKTTGLDRPGNVNLEKAMRFGDRIDGHLVSGHIDGTGTVTTFERKGESWLLIVEAPAALSKYFAYKGSVAVNGVSLTVNEVEDVKTAGCRISINLIPHTLAVTTLSELRQGSSVNLEVDMISRYVERMLPRMA